MGNNPNQFGQSKVPNPFDEEATRGTTTRDSETSRDTESSRSESDAEWERSIGARDMDIWCYWHFDSDKIEAKYDGKEGHGNTVADALEDLAEGLRRSD